MTSTIFSSNAFKNKNIIISGGAGNKENLTDYKLKECDFLMNINALFVFLISKLVASPMIKQDHGKKPVST